MTAFVALVGAVGWAASLVLGYGLAGLVVAVIVAGAGSVVAWWKSDAIALRVSRARPAAEVDCARLHNLVEGLCIAAGLPKPRLYVVDDDAPNAFATGRDPRHAAVAVTTGLLDKLNRVELEGVLAHELSHVKNNQDPPGGSQDGRRRRRRARLSGERSEPVVMARRGPADVPGDTRPVNNRRIALAVATAVVLLAAVVAAVVLGRGSEQAAPPTTSPPTTAVPTTTAPPTFPLTGLLVDDPARAARPALVVKVDNTGKARGRQTGLSAADVVYVELVEGGATPGRRLPLH